jgi:hypothetical protein
MLAPAKDLLSEAKPLYSAYAEGGIATESLCGSTQSTLAYHAGSMRPKATINYVFTFHNELVLDFVFNNFVANPRGLGNT